MMMTDYFRIALLSTLLFAEVATVSAQDYVRGETVATRPRPDYDAVGAPVGRFLLFPNATLDFVYDDNILAADKSTPNLVLSDTIVLLAPELELRSDWSRNALNVGGRVLDARYDEYSTQDFTDYRLFADGELEFGPNMLIADINHSQLHELRTSGNDFASNPATDLNGRPIFPTIYTLDNFEVGYRYSPNRLFVGATVGLAKYEFDDVLGIDSGENIFVIDNGDRNRLNSEFSLRLGYFMSPSTSLFLQSRLYDFDYDRNIDRFGNNLDQDGYTLVLGSDFDLTGVISGQIFVGYRNIDYADDNFDTQNGPTFGATVDWNITQLTTITFLASQNLYGTTVQNSSGIQAAAFGVAVNHELRRNVILNLAIDYIDEDYLQITRNDDVARIRVGAEYFLTRNWSLNGGYRYQQRESNVTNGNQFEVNQFYLGIRGQI